VLRIASFFGGKVLWWGVGIAVASSLALHGWQALKVYRLEAKVARLEATNGHLERDLAQCLSANKAWLDVDAQRQEALSALKLECDAREARAASAIATLRASEAEALRQERALRAELRTVLETEDCAHLSEVPVCPAAADRLRD
jgi:hypothetical protein